MTLSERDRKMLELENERLSAMSKEDLDAELTRQEQERRREAARSLIRKPGPQQERPQSARARKSSR